MSDTLFEYEMQIFESKSEEERIELFKNNCCRCCRLNGCNKILPSDIGKPIRSDKAYFPSFKGCEDFEWD